MFARRFLPPSLTLSRPRAGLVALACGFCAGCLCLPPGVAGEPIRSNQEKLVQEAPASSAAPQPALALPISIAPAIAVPVDPRPRSQTAEFTTFHLTTKDRHISEAMRRFASAHGWKLSWEIDRDFAIAYAATFSGSFLDIVEQVARSLQNANTPIRVKAYHGNHVLRVLYATY